MIHIALADTYWQSNNEVNIVDQMVVVPFINENEFSEFCRNPLTEYLTWVYLPDMKNVKAKWSLGGLSLKDRLMKETKGNEPLVDQIVSLINHYKTKNEEGTNGVEVCQVDIKDIDSPWAFVEKFLPNYSTSEDVSESNDLEMIVDGDWINSECATEIRNEIVEEYKENNGIEPEDFQVVEIAQAKLSEVNACIYELAIDGFIETMKNK